MEIVTKGNFSMAKFMEKESSLLYQETAIMENGKTIGVLVMEYQ
jgi:hypothetical protein